MQNRQFVAVVVRSLSSNMFLSRHRSSAIIIVCSLLVGTAKLYANDQWLAAALSYVRPVGALARDLDAKPALGFQLAYQFEAEKILRLGFGGTWMSSRLGTTPTGTDLSTFDLTMYQIHAMSRLRFLKHGWSPYVEAELGMSFLTISQEVANMPRRIDGLEDVRPSVAAAIGVQVPVNETVDIDVRGRFTFTRADVDDDFGTAGIAAGIVWKLR